MRWAYRNRFAPLASLAVAVLAAGFAIGMYAGERFGVLELETVDARFGVRPDRSADDVAFVAIDDVTLSDLNLQWPFRRSLHARVVDRLQRAGARVIAYDIQFTEPTRVAEDNALVEAVDGAERIVLGTTEVDEQGGSRVLGGDEVLTQVGARAGNAILNNDKGGVQRRFPYEVDGLESFAVVASELASDRQIAPSEFGRRDAWIDFLGAPGAVPTFAFSRVLRGEVPPAAFRGRVVVVGAAAPRLQDVHAVPTSDELMAGGEVQANAISTMLRGLPLTSAPGTLSVLVIVLMAFAAPAAGLRVGTLRMLAGVLALGLLYVGVALLAFRAGWILPMTYPLAALATATVGALGTALLLGTIERQRVRDAFARFVPEPVVSEVLAKTNEDLRLGGVRRRVTVLFSDLRGFTAFSETLPPDLVIDVLNRYLESMSDAVLDNGGTLVAYMGDGIMAVFGAPLEQEDHADRAVAAAREMAGERLARFNAWVAAEGHGEGFSMGVGLNTGHVMSGNVGSRRRLEYTAIGDTTNTAARLEGMTKGTPHQVFISDSTRRCLTTEPHDAVDVGELEVRGRAQPLRVWALADLDKPAAKTSEPPLPEQRTGSPGNPGRPGTGGPSHPLGA